MINIQETNNVKTSNQFESRQMSISPEFFNKMIWHTIKQYKYKVRTSLQELISNAQDAQVEASNADRPLKITLPTKLEKVCKIRDFGTGMTPDVINNIYCNMGSSGSSYTNAKKGGFGIGGKSPLGFCDQYSIRTIVDGTEWTYSIYKNATNGISVDLVYTGETTEENGTEVQLPVAQDQVKEFIKGCCRATMFWDVQPEFNLDKEELFTVSGGVKISDKVSIYSHEELSNMFGETSKNYYGHYNKSKEIIILVDGIPYLLDSEFYKGSIDSAFSRLHNSKVLVIKTTIGELKVLQTRESLEDCKLTRDGLERIGTEVIKDINEYIKKETKKNTLLETIEAQKTITDTFSQWDDILFESFAVKNGAVLLPLKMVKKVNDKGQEISENKFQATFIKYHHRTKRRSYYRKNNKLQNAVRSVTKGRSIDFDEMGKIYLDDLKNESSNKKARRLRYSIEANQGEVILLTDLAPELYNLILTHFDFPMLSSLPMPPKNVSKKGTGTTKLVNDEVLIHHWGSHGTYGTKSKTTIKTNTDKRNFVYVNSNDYFSTDWRLLVIRKGYFPCMIGKKYTSKLKDNANFISLDEFKAQLVLTQREKLAIIREYVGLDRYKNDIKVMKKSYDLTARKLAQKVNLPKADIYKMPQSLTNLIINSNADYIAELRKAKRQMKRRITKRYYNDLDSINTINRNLTGFKGA